MLKGVGAFAAMLILGGCATVTRGTTDQVQMRSAPSGAIATASMGQSCTTPCTITVGRKDEFSVHFEKPGFVSQDVQVKTQASGPGQAALAGNLIVGGIVGLATDGWVRISGRRRRCSDIRPIRATCTSSRRRFRSPSVLTSCSAQSPYRKASATG